MRFPQYKKVVGLNGREVNFSIVSTQFKHNTKGTNETGTRTHAQATFTRDIKPSNITPWSLIISQFYKT
jgi:hypothetical protein